MSGLTLGLLAGMAGFCLLMAWPLLNAIRRQERTASRLTMVQQRVLMGDLARRRAEGETSAGLIANLGGWLARHLLSERTVQEVRDTLVGLGFPGKRAVGIFIGAKLLLFIGMPIAAYGLTVLADVSGQTQMLAAAFGAVAGLMLPEAVVRNLRGRYLKEVERGTADGLDLIVICSEAGLGLEAAIQRTAIEIKPAWPAFANELATTAYELRMLTDRRAALAGMGERTQLEPLRRLARVMGQSQQYGTPLSQALRTLSAELRQDQLIAFEARAAKLPVLLTLPMILFILPTVFLVVAGPAMIAVLKFM